MQVIGESSAQVRPRLTFIPADLYLADIISLAASRSTGEPEPSSYIIRCKLPCLVVIRIIELVVYCLHPRSKPVVSFRSQCFHSRIRTVDNPGTTLAYRDISLKRQFVNAYPVRIKSPVIVVTLRVIHALFRHDLIIHIPIGDLDSFTSHLFRQEQSRILCGSLVL